jgi:hypothetical protein
MRQDDRTDTASQKAIARQKYRERKMDQFIKWSIATKGYVRLEDIERINNQYNTNKKDSYGK